MTDFLALARSLGPATATFPVEAVAEALSVYAGGRSVELTARETGLPIPRIEQWVERSGIKRTRAQTLALQRDLANARHRAAKGF